MKFDVDKLKEFKGVERVDRETLDNWLKNNVYDGEDVISTPCLAKSELANKGREILGLGNDYAEGGMWYYRLLELVSLETITDLFDAIEQKITHNDREPLRSFIIRRGFFNENSIENNAEAAQMVDNVTRDRCWEKLREFKEYVDSEKGKVPIIIGQVAKLEAKLEEIGLNEVAKKGNDSIVDGRFREWYPGGRKDLKSIDSTLASLKGNLESIYYEAVKNGLTKSQKQEYNGKAYNCDPGTLNSSIEVINSIQTSSFKPLIGSIKKQLIDDKLKEIIAREACVNLRENNLESASKELDNANDRGQEGYFQEAIRKLNKELTEAQNEVREAQEGDEARMAQNRLQRAQDKIQAIRDKGSRNYFREEIDRLTEAKTNAEALLQTARDEAQARVGGEHDDYIGVVGNMMHTHAVAGMSDAIADTFGLRASGDKSAKMYSAPLLRDNNKLARLKAEIKKFIESEEFLDAFVNAIEVFLGTRAVYDTYDVPEWTEGARYTALREAITDLKVDLPEELFTELDDDDDISVPKENAENILKPLLKLILAQLGVLENADIDALKADLKNIAGLTDEEIEKISPVNPEEQARQEEQARAEAEAQAEAERAREAEIAAQAEMAAQARAAEAARQAEMAAQARAAEAARQAEIAQVRAAEEQARQAAQAQEAEAAARRVAEEQARREAEEPAVQEEAPVQAPAVSAPVAATPAKPAEIAEEPVKEEPVSDNNTAPVKEVTPLIEPEVIIKARKENFTTEVIVKQDKALDAAISSAGTSSGQTKEVSVVQKALVEKVASNAFSGDSTLANVASGVLQTVTNHMYKASAGSSSSGSTETSVETIESASHEQVSVESLIYEYAHEVEHVKHNDSLFLAGEIMSVLADAY